VLSGTGLCDELIPRPEEPTDFGASLCVIYKPRERGGPGPLGAVAPKQVKVPPSLHVHWVI